MTKDEWTNDTPLDIRTKIALKVLLLMIKILSPYRFKHEYEKEFDAIAKDIYSVN